MARKKKSDTDDAYETEAEVDAAEDAETASAADDDGRVEVEVTADHVYLPLDGEGNVPANWRKGANVRVEKGTKLKVPADLLEALGDKVEASS